MRRVGQAGSFGESREILRSLYGSHASGTRRSVGQPVTCTRRSPRYSDKHVTTIGYISRSLPTSRPHSLHLRVGRLARLYIFLDDARGLIVHAYYLDVGDFPCRHDLATTCTFGYDPPSTFERTSNRVVSVNCPTNKITHWYSTLVQGMIPSFYSIKSTLLNSYDRAGTIEADEIIDFLYAPIFK